MELLRAGHYLVARRWAAAMAAATAATTTTAATMVVHPRIMANFFVQKIYHLIDRIDRFQTSVLHAGVQQFVVLGLTN